MNGATKRNIFCWCDLTLDETQSATGIYDTQTGYTGIKHCNKNIFHSKCVIVFEINWEKMCRTYVNICSSKEGRLYRNLKWNRHLLSWWRLVQVCKSVTIQKRHKTISFHFLFNERFPSKIPQAFSYIILQYNHLFNSIFLGNLPTLTQYIRDSQNPTKVLYKACSLFLIFKKVRLLPNYLYVNSLFVVLKIAQYKRPHE